MSFYYDDAPDLKYRTVSFILNVYFNIPIFKHYTNSGLRLVLTYYNPINCMYRPYSIKTLSEQKLEKYLWPNEKELNILFQISSL